MGPLEGKLPRFLVLASLLLVLPVQESQAQVGPEASNITGMVLIEDDDSPASGVVVKVQSLEGGLCVGVLTDQNGEFETESLAPGNYEVYAEKSGYESTRITTKPEDKVGAVRVYLRTNRQPANATDAVVSVRELQMPDKARDAFAKGVQHLLRGEYAASLEHFQKAVKLHPAFYEAHYNIGAVQLRLHHDEESMAALQKAIDLSGGKMALARFTMGLLLWQTGKAKEAEAVLRRALEQDANYPKGYVLLGATLYDQGKIDEAEKYVTEAEFRQPQMATPYLIHAKIEMLRGNAAKVLRCLERYLRLEAPGANRDAAAVAYQQIQARLRQQSNSQQP